MLGMGKEWNLCYVIFGLQLSSFIMAKLKISDDKKRTDNYCWFSECVDETFTNFYE